MKKMIKKISIGAVVAFLMVYGWYSWEYNFTYSEGERVGVVQKFSKKGNVFKTYEGELLLTNGMNSEKFLFSVSEDSVASKLMSVEGQKVAIHYEQKHSTLPWRGETTYFVNSVETK
jgi:hypothetical protein